MTDDDATIAGPEASGAGKSDSPSNYDLMCMAVGRLFLIWARLENELAAVLRWHLIRSFEKGQEEVEDIKDRAARTACAIYGSMRFKAAKDTIKRIAVEEGFGDDALAFMSSLFQQISHIEDFRDKIAHQLLRPADHNEQEWTVTDIVTTRNLANIKVHGFKTQAVVDAGEDLETAANRIGGFLTKRGEPPFDVSPIAWKFNPGAVKLRPPKEETPEVDPAKAAPAAE